MTTVETNIVAVERVKSYRDIYPYSNISENAAERVKEYTETPTEVNSSYFIYITRVVITTKGEIVRMTNRVQRVASEKELRGISAGRESEPETHRGVVSENDNRAETNIVAVERVKEYTETPTEVNRGNKRMTIELETNIVLGRESEGIQEKLLQSVNSSYFIYIPTQGGAMRMTQQRDRASEKWTTELGETNIVVCRERKEYTKPYRGVVSENDNELETNIVAVESEGIHRNSYRGK
ncbi:ABCC1 [Mytilus edulis]|uniref:ABCC1 n=1 Tax=Mytilus edulis TaxID=6550 RepID=A0A8S3VG06_MYTED|nr:ABCC1 [Mytilus edulis]